MKGSSAVYDQNVKANLWLVDLDYRVRFGAFEAGVVGAWNYGAASSLAAADTTKKKGSFNLGPEVAYRLGDADYDLIATLAADFSVGVKNQTNSEVLVGLQYWIKCDAAAMAQATPSRRPTVAFIPPPPVTVAAPSAPPAVATLAPAAGIQDAPVSAPEKLVTLRLKPSLIQFEPNSDKLKPAAQKQVEGLGRALALQQANWETLEVSGHSDSKTKDPARNQLVSELRAKAVRAMFVSAGVTAEHAVANGYGSSQPLAGLAGEAPAQRRIELRFTNVKNKAAVVESLHDYLAD